MSRQLQLHAAAHNIAMMFIINAAIETSGGRLMWCELGKKSFVTGVNQERFNNSYLDVIAKRERAGKDHWSSKFKDRKVDQIECFDFSDSFDFYGLRSESVGFLFLNFNRIRVLAENTEINFHTA